MASLRPPKLSVVAVAAAIAGSLLLPDVPARAAPLTLQVTREITATDTGTASLVATISENNPDADSVRVNFQILPADDQADPDGVCEIATGAKACEAKLKRGEPAVHDVRAWIEGTEPDTAEGRLAKKKGVLPVATAAEDCQSGLLGGDDPPDCETGTETPGSQAEPDATDVVSVAWTTYQDARLDCRDAKGSDGTDVEYNDSAQNESTETYACTLTNAAGAPIPGYWLEHKMLPKMRSAANKSAAEPLCQTGDDGTCSGTVTVDTPGTQAVLCFWAEPASAADATKGQDQTYDPAGGHTDGSACDDVNVEETVGSELTDVVYLDYGPARPEGLDVQPDDLLAQGSSRFSLRATVYDQFGRPFVGTTKVNAELFEGSRLAGDNASDVSQPDLSCTTDNSDACTIVTEPQDELGKNIACVWLDAKTPTRMIGQGDQPDISSPTCTGKPAPWQAGDQSGEGRLDGTNDDGAPAPPTDGLDVVRFAVQSQPKIALVTPPERRQNVADDVLVVEGSGFHPSAVMTISGTGVKLGPTAVVSGARIEASLDVAPDAPAGPRDITIRNRNDGGAVTCSECFRVIGQGYWLVASDGGVFAYGDAKYTGSPEPGTLNKPIVSMAATPSGLGYWMVAADGGIFAYGDAPFLGSAGSLELSKPIVSMAPTPSGKGYWLVASDGGVFGYGDARFYGATSRLTLSKPIVSIVPTPSGRGYWLVASDGGIFAFGDARFFGGTGDLVLNQPIVAMAATKTGKGYWLVASDGGLFAYGDAVFYGSAGGQERSAPIVAITVTPMGKGYWMVASDGTVFAFGDAQMLGSTSGVPLNQPIVALARR
ncbi:MAG TPA: hypothetical protein VEG38_18720 [Acidimicrobiia bacterium]|nr:hypothetical protein [Acidimicrobiia bacterium]